MMWPKSMPRSGHGRGLLYGKLALLLTEWEKAVGIATYLASEPEPAAAKISFSISLSAVAPSVQSTRP